MTIKTAKELIEALQSMSEKAGTSLDQEVYIRTKYGFEEIELEVGDGCFVLDVMN